MTLKFGQNSLAATNAFTLNITDPGRVEELPDFVKEGLAADAKARGEKGWTVTLQYPSYVPFMTYSSDREAKEQLWRASNARALGGEFDNCENIRRIVDLRRQIAGLLGYETYADYVLEERMAENTATVNAFLQELLDETIDYARADYAMINDYAHAQGFEGDVMPWDWHRPTVRRCMLWMRRPSAASCALSGLRSRKCMKMAGWSAMPARRAASRKCTAS